MSDGGNETIQKQLDVISGKLDRLDEAIRGTHGNGSRPGILLRLDRLEQNASRQGKLIWMIVGAAITGLSTTVVMWITG